MENIPSQRFCLVCNIKGCEHVAPKHPRSDTYLSNREQQVIEWVCRGYTDKLVAYELGLTTGTVKAYALAAMRKVRKACPEVRNRVGLAGWAYRNGLINPQTGERTGKGKARPVKAH